MHDDGERLTLGMLRRLRGQARYRLQADACNRSRHVLNFTLAHEEIITEIF